MTVNAAPGFARPHWIKAIGLLTLASVGLVGCAISKDDVLPTDLPAMKTIYDAHFAQRPAQRTQRPAAQSVPERTPTPNAPGWIAVSTRTGAPTPADERVGDAAPLALGAEAVHARFERLPNPDLMMYVFPHRVGDEGLPIPGYVTVFPLYARTHYALPGERR